MILEVSQLRRWVLLPELKLMELKTRNLQNYMGLALVFQARMKDIHLTVMGLTKSRINVWRGWTWKNSKHSLVNQATSNKTNGKRNVQYSKKR